MESILEWIGYSASAIIALSMAMSSIVKFRVINLIGAALFSVYGLLIGSIPVALLNSFIVVVDIYYLVCIFSKKEVFDTFKIDGDDRYLGRFLEHYGADIRRFFPSLEQGASEKSTHCFFVLRNATPAGLFLAGREAPDTLRVDVDYVVPDYRDFKSGRFIFHRLKDELVSEGISRVVAEAHVGQHERYLRRLGFQEAADGRFEMKVAESARAAPTTAS